MDPKGQNQGQQETNLPIKRTEKVLTAVYLVSEHVSDNPLKDKIRNNALELVSTIRCLNCVLSRENFSKALLFAEDLNACINLATTMKFISEMNGGVISRVLSEIITALQESQGSSLILDVSLPVSSEVKALAAAKEATKISANESFQKKTKKAKPKAISAKVLAKASGKKPVAPANKPSQPNGRKGTVSPAHWPALVAVKKSLPAKAKPNGIKIESPLNGPVSNVLGVIKDKDKGQESPFAKGQTIDQKERRDAVIAIARDLGRFSIKDVARRMPEISEKTIQRELSVLIDVGILKKQGEKRWVEYFL